MITGICKNCGCQIHAVKTADNNYYWIDNSGGDVCGIDGDNAPHVDSIDDFLLDFSLANSDR
jgi:hypothetical protein